MEAARFFSQWATCPRRSVGAVIVRDGRILASGYNGSLPGEPHCTDAGCLMVDGHCKRTVHAEMNALCAAARFGTALDGSVCYVTLQPCKTCEQALRAAGVTMIRYDEEYQ